MTRAIVKDAANLPTLEEDTSARLYVDTRGRLHTASIGGGGGGDASAANQETQIVAEEAIQVAIESLDEKTLTPIGTAFSATAATVTESATQLPSVPYARGFSIQNIDSSTPIYVGSSSGVTSSNGWRIAAGEKEFFNLLNSSILYVISPSGTVNIRIGAIL